jgi:hypothetical protein
MALMSAANNPTSTNAGRLRSRCRTRSAYLIALTVGRYEFRPLGPLNGVYAEPQLLDDTAYEMQFVPQMFDAAQRVIAAYPFERYDLVFPPKYSGGMENPELNFIGQDIITGNHPAVVPPHGVIAHEMSHSWFGDTLTCATWSDLWQNESFATYYEKRIEEEMAPPTRRKPAFIPTGRRWRATSHPSRRRACRCYIERSSEATAFVHDHLVPEGRDVPENHGRHDGPRELRCLHRALLSVERVPLGR